MHKLFGYSVIISSLGREIYLYELLDSILEQTVPPTEIILLLDNNDHCSSLAERLLTHRYLRVELCIDFTLAEKRNYGSSLAITDTVIFSDDDDIWDKERASEVLDRLRYSQIVCHGFSKFGIYSKKNILLLGSHSRFVKKMDLISGSNLFGGGSGIAGRKSVIQAFPFDANYRYCEDLEWWIRVILSGANIFYIARPLVSYRVHSTNMTSINSKIECYRLRIAYDLFKSGTFLVLVSCLLTCKASIKMLLGSISRLIHLF